MDIQTSLKRFTYDAKISGSGRQKTLDSFNLLVKRFNDRNLDLIKSQLEAQQSGDTVQLAAINSEMERLVRLRYLTAINFALNHSSSEVAPYIALTEVFDANVKYLDTIYNALSDQVVKSKYGRTLRSFIDERKKTMDSLD